MKNYFVIFLLLLTGCAYNHSLVKENGEISLNNEKLAPINLTVRQIRPITFDDARNLNHLFSEMATSEKFAAVGNGSVSSPFYIDIIYSEEPRNNPFEMVWYFTSALTLFLLPHPLEIDQEIDVSVYYTNKLLKKYRFTNKYEGYSHWGNLPIIGSNDSQKILVENLINSIEKDKIIPKFLEIRVIKEENAI